MCGICGIVDFNKPIEDGGARVAAMNATLVHRGPDDEGMLSRPYAALAMRRLSIIDVAGGRQPISSEDGAVSIVYNGETYNFPELRNSLLAKGHRFSTNTDTEAVLHLYEEYGPGCLDKMNGMYAFAVLDEKQRCLLLARDRLGIKPLYYYFSSGRLYFASEIKALLAHPDVPRTLNYQALSHYLAHLYIPGDGTIFNGIKCLPPGHYILFDGGHCEQKTYWKLEFKPRKISFEEAAGELDALLQDAVRMNLISDVPLGAFLSGGIDSSLVTALMSQAGGRVKTFSIGFKEEGFDERGFARLVAERYATEHEEFVVDYPGIPDFLQRMARCFDQPFADAAAIPAFVLAQNARKKVTVALSGNGGDELFGGYTKYLAEKYNIYMQLAPKGARSAALRLLERLLPESPGLADRNRRIKRLLRYSLEPTHIRPVSWSVGFSPESQRTLLRPEIAEHVNFDTILSPWTEKFASCSCCCDTLSSQLYTDITTYLPDNNLLKDDIMGMANSLETRVPLLDHRIAEFTASLPSDFHINGFNMKHLLKKVAHKYLPDEIIRRPKQGFTVPVGKWINGMLSDFTDNSLLSAESPICGYFNVENVRKHLEEHRRGRADQGMRLWSLLVFRAWHDEFFKG